MARKELINPAGVGIILILAIVVTLVGNAVRSHTAVFTNVEVVVGTGVVVARSYTPGSSRPGRNARPSRYDVAVELDDGRGVRSANSRGWYEEYEVGEAVHVAWLYPTNALRDLQRRREDLDTSYTPPVDKSWLVYGIGYALCASLLVAILLQALRTWRARRTGGG